MSDYTYADVLIDVINGNWSGNDEPPAAPPILTAQDIRDVIGNESLLYPSAKELAAVAQHVNTPTDTLRELSALAVSLIEDGASKRMGHLSAYGYILVDALYEHHNHHPDDAAKIATIHILTAALSD